MKASDLFIFKDINDEWAKEKFALKNDHVKIGPITVFYKMNDCENFEQELKIDGFFSWI